MGEHQQQERPFCLNEAMHSGFARFGRALGRFTSLCRHPTHASSDPPAQPRSDDFRVGNVDTIPEDETADATNGSKEDVEQGLSHASSSSVRRRTHGLDMKRPSSAACSGPHLQLHPALLPVRVCICNCGTLAVALPFPRPTNLMQAIITATCLPSACDAPPWLRPSENCIGGVCHAQELMVVPNPYADAVPLPSKKSIDAAAAERKLTHSVSTSSSTDSTDSASQIQNYISTHYNVRA
jgi:hypothetical protein